MKKFFAKLHFFINYIVPVILIAGIIFYLSSQSGLGDIKNNTVEIFLRKSAHFIEYGLLSFFVWRLFYYGWQFFLPASFWFSLILVLLYAISDERHQFFIEGRSGKIIDVIVDFLSAFVVLQAINFFKERKKKYLVWLSIGFIFFSSIVGGLILETRITDQEIKQKSNNDNQAQLNVKKGFNKINTERDDRALGKDIKQDKNSDVDEDKSINVQKLSKDKIILPKKFIQKVPFTTQSPFAKWDQLHEESCEEASLIILKYHNDKKKLTKQMAEKEIQKLIKYQIEKYGDFYDTDVQITKQIGEDFYHLSNLKIIKDFTINDLKKELVQGSVILIPTAGRELHNPNFKAPGPLYHNLVIIGYDDTIDEKTNKSNNIFITNDPGTRRGENYKYNQQLLYEAIHDFPGDVNKILEGKKRALVLIRQKIEN